MPDARVDLGPLLMKRKATNRATTPGDIGTRGIVLSGENKGVDRLLCYREAGSLFFAYA